MKCLHILWILSLLLLLPLSIVHAETTAVLRPMADGGNDNANWTNTLGVPCNTENCYLEVQESSGSFCTSSDGDATFIGNSTNGAEQTFDIDESIIPDSSTVTKIDITVCYKWKGGGPTAPTFETRSCIDGSCINSMGTITGGSSYQEITQSHAVNFQKNSASDIEIGVTSTNEKNIRITQISAVVTYSPPAGPPPPPSTEPPPPPSTEPPQPSGGGGSAQRIVIFSGYAYPESTIEVLRKSVDEEHYKPTESMTVAGDGAFSIEYKGLYNLEYFFALRVKDRDGRDTGILSFNVPKHVEVWRAKDLLIPPTIGFEGTSIAKNAVTKFVGFATPHHTVELEIDGVKYAETKADGAGFWTIAMDTTYLAYGEHSARVRQVAADSRASNFSFTRVFALSKLLSPATDLNADSVVDIRDWSIFLFRWNHEDPAVRLQNDLNGDGIINIFDFSIFLQAMKT